MNFGQYVKNGFRMLIFDSKAVKQVVADREAKKNGTIMLFLLSALAGIVVGAFYYLMLYFVTRLEGDFPVAPPAYHFLIAAVVVFFIALLSHLLSVGLTHLFAKLFGSKRPIVPYFAVWMAVGLALLVVTVPVLLLSLVEALAYAVMIAFTVYSLALAVFIVRESYRVPTGKALAITLLPILVLLVLVAVIMLLFPAPVV